MFAPVIGSATIATPGGLQFSFTDTRTADLSDPNDPFSFKTLTDSYDVNGETYTRTYAAATKTVTETTPMGRKLTATIDG